jgi:hypothetical protein
MRFRRKLAVNAPRVWPLVKQGVEQPGTLFGNRFLLSKYQLPARRPHPNRVEQFGERRIKPAQLENAGRSDADQRGSPDRSFSRSLERQSICDRSNQNHRCCGAGKKYDRFWNLSGEIHQ